MDDLISRRAAIDAVRGRFSMPVDNLIVEVIGNLTSARQWIPVSERLPEDFQEVTITWVNRDPEAYYAYIKDKQFTGAAVYFSGKTDRWRWSFYRKAKGYVAFEKTI